jgi:CRISPR-associated endonuclease Csn1
MEKILGIDLGTNSIGWAIRDLNEDENQIIDKGVLIFDKGVAEDKSGEHPMVQKRTDARGIRRNYQAEKYRKWELLKTLIENNMCPSFCEKNTCFFKGPALYGRIITFVIPVISIFLAFYRNN